MAAELGSPTNMEDVSRLGTIWGVVASFTILSTAIVGLRTYARKKIVKDFGKDDGFVVAAMIFNIAYAGCFLASGYYGLGRHSLFVNIESLLLCIQAVWVSAICYGIVNCLAKLSVLFFYLRIDCLRIGCPPWFRTASLIAMFLLVTSTIGGVLTVVFQCMPFSYQWVSLSYLMKNAVRHVPMNGEKCLNMIPVYYVTSGINMFLDVVIYLLPMPVVIKLEIPSKQKMGLVAILGVGASICIISAIRIVSLAELTNSYDVTWNTTNPMIWYFVEVNLIIIAGSIPSLKALTRLIPRGLFRKSKNRSRHDPFFDPEDGSIIGIKSGDAFIGVGEEGRMGIKMGAVRVPPPALSRLWSGAWRH